MDSDAVVLLLALIIAPLLFGFMVALFRGYNIHFFFWRPNGTSHEFRFGPKYTMKDQDERNGPGNRSDGDGSSE